MLGHGKRTLEAVRYLGYGKHAVDDQTLALIRDSFEDLERVAKRRIVYRIFELKVSDEEHLNIADRLFMIAAATSGLFIEYT